MKEIISLAELVDTTTITKIAQLEKTRYETIVSSSPASKNHISAIGRRFDVSEQTYSKVSISIGIPKNLHHGQCSLYDNSVARCDLYDGESTTQDVVYLMVV
jgi:hypothetical protein